MNAGDARDLAILIVATIVPAVLLAWLLARKRPGWRGWVRIAVAAAPVPLLVAVLCGAVYVRAATAPREECGVDACGMAMMFAGVGVAAALVAYAVGLLAAWLTARLVAR